MTKSSYAAQQNPNATVSTETILHTDSLPKASEYLFDDAHIDHTAIDVELAIPKPQDLHQLPAAVIGRIADHLATLSLTPEATSLVLGLFQADLAAPDTTVHRMRGYLPNRLMQVPLPFKARKHDRSYLIDVLHDPDVVAVVPLTDPLVIPDPAKDDAHPAEFNVPATHFVVRRHSAGWVMVSDHRAWRRLVQRQPRLYTLSPDGYSVHCAAARRWAAAQGLTFDTVCTETISPTRIRNLEYLDQTPPRPVSGPLLAAVVAIVNASPGIRYAELMRRQPACTQEVLCTLLQLGELHTDLAETLLLQPDSLRLYRTPELRDFQRPLPPMVPPDLHLVPGCALTMDGTTYHVSDTPVGHIVAHAPDGSPRTFSIPQVLSRVAQGTATLEQPLSAGQTFAAETLRKASPAQLKAADRRFAKISHLIGFAYDLPAARRMDHRISPHQVELLRIYRQNYALGLRRAQTLLPDYAARGRSRCQLPEPVNGMVESVLWKLKRHPNACMTYGYILLCRWCSQRSMATGQTIKPPTRETFRLRWNKGSTFANTLGTQGAREAQPHRASMTALIDGYSHHGDAPFMLAHIDHTPIDCKFVHTLTGLPLGSGWLTVMIDSYTRLILAMYVSFEAPSHASVKAVIRECCCRHGYLPRTIVTDNGPEFCSEHTTALLTSLSSEHLFRPPGEPKYGAVMERIFGTINGRFTHFLEGNTRPALAFHALTPLTDPDERKVWNLPDAARLLRKFAYEVYPDMPHSGIMATPALKYRHGGGKSRGNRITDFLGLLFLTCCELASPRKVTSGRGVSVRGLSYNHDSFNAFGKASAPVAVRYDPTDLNYVYAYFGGRWQMCFNRLFQDNSQLCAAERQAFTAQFRQVLKKVHRCNLTPGYLGLFGEMVDMEKVLRGELARFKPPAEAKQKPAPASPSQFQAPSALGRKSRTVAA